MFHFAIVVLLNATTANAQEVVSPVPQGIEVCLEVDQESQAQEARLRIQAKLDKAKDISVIYGGPAESWPGILGAKSEDARIWEPRLDPMLRLAVFEIGRPTDTQMLAIR